MRNIHEFLAAVIGILLIVYMENRIATTLTGFVVLGLLYLRRLRSAYSSIRLHLVNNDNVNEVLLVEAYVANRPALFMIDSGYAGPPVLSASYLAVTDVPFGSIDKRYARVVGQMSSQQTIDEQHAAIDAFIETSGCFAYTSGCTMRLMGIGETQEQQADMLMCPMLELKCSHGGFVTPKRSVSNAHADVFVTHSLPGSVHILTCDFMLHSAPCLLDFEALTMHLNLSPDRTFLHRRTFHMQPLEMSGGSFVVTINIGGVDLRCTVDTGSPGAICIGTESAARLKTCSQQGKPRAISQQGVNGEKVCSEIITAPVRFCNQNFNAVPILANNMNVDQVDGYVGLGFLRGFNLLIAPFGIGFSRNQMALQSVDVFNTVSQDGNCGLNLKCVSPS